MKVYNQSVIKSFGYAFEGLWHALKFNRNLRIDIAAALLVIVLGVLLGVSLLEKIILGLVISIVIFSEMMNTAIEEMVNLITNEHKREAKIAKDVAAGMVLVAAIGSVIVGILIFTPYVLRLFY